MPNLLVVFFGILNTIKAQKKGVNVMPKAKREERKEASKVINSLKELDYKLLLLQAQKKEEEKIRKEIAIYKKMIEVFDEVLSKEQQKEIKVREVKRETNKEMKVMKEEKKEERKEEKKENVIVNIVKLSKTKKRLLKQKIQQKTIDVKALTKVVAKFVANVYVWKFIDKKRINKPTEVKVNKAKLPSTPKGWRKRAIKLAYEFNKVNTIKRIILNGMVKIFINKQNKQKVQTQTQKQVYVLKFGYNFKIEIPKISGIDLFLIINKIKSKYQEFAPLLNVIDFVENSEIPTAMTDGWRIYYNPQFIASQDELFAESVIIHELLHIIRKDIQTLKKFNLNPYLWNLATDKVINEEIISEYGGNNIPLLVKIHQSNIQYIEQSMQKSIANLDEYEIYIELNQKQQQEQDNGNGNSPQQQNKPQNEDKDEQNNNNNNQNNNDSNLSDNNSNNKQNNSNNNNQNNKQNKPNSLDELKEIEENEDELSESEKEYRRKIDEAIKQYHQLKPQETAKRRGDGNITEKLILNKVQEKVKVNLRKIAKEIEKKSLYENPIKRQISGIIEFPTKYEKPDVVIVLDVSGSMTTQIKENITPLDIAQIVIKEIDKQFNIIKIYTGNTELVEVRKTINFKELNAGGGTDMKKVLKQIEEQKKIRKQNIILITDAEDDLENVQSSNNVYGVFITDKIPNTNLPYTRVYLEFLDLRELSKSMEIVELKDLKDLIKACAEEQITLMIWGYYGIGKTQIVRQATQEIGYELIEINVPEMTEEDIKGIRIYSEKRDEIIAKVYGALSEINPDKKTLIYLDEINRTRNRDILNALLKIILDKTLPFIKLTPQQKQNITFVVTANPEDESVYELDAALLNRMCQVFLMPTLEIANDEVWIEYISNKHKIKPEILRKLLKGVVLEFDDKFKVNTTPRGLEKVIEIIVKFNFKLNDTYKHIVKGLINREAGEIILNNLAKILDNLENLSEKILKKFYNENFNFNQLSLQEKRVLVEVIQKETLKYAENMDLENYQKILKRISELIIFNEENRIILHQVMLPIYDKLEKINDKISENYNKYDEDAFMILYNLKRIRDSLKFLITDEVMKKIENKLIKQGFKHQGITEVGSKEEIFLSINYYPFVRENLIEIHLKDKLFVKTISGGIINKIANLKTSFIGGGYLYYNHTHYNDKTLFKELKEIQLTTDEDLITIIDVMFEISKNYKNPIQYILSDYNTNSFTKILIYISPYIKEYFRIKIYKGKWGLEFVVYEKAITNIKAFFKFAGEFNDINELRQQQQDNKINLKYIDKNLFFLIDEELLKEGFEYQGASELDELASEKVYVKYKYYPYIRENVVEIHTKKKLYTKKISGGIIEKILRKSILRNYLAVAYSFYNIESVLKEIKEIFLIKLDKSLYFKILDKEILRKGFEVVGDAKFKADYLILKTNLKHTIIQINRNGYLYQKQTRGIIMSKQTFKYIENGYFTEIIDCLNKQDIFLSIKALKETKLDNETLTLYKIALKIAEHIKAQGYTFECHHYPDIKTDYIYISVYTYNKTDFRILYNGSTNLYIYNPENSYENIKRIFKLAGEYKGYKDFEQSLTTKKVVNPKYIVLEFKVQEEILKEIEAKFKQIFYFGGVEVKIKAINKTNEVIFNIEKFDFEGNKFIIKLIFTYKQIKFKAQIILNEYHINILAIINKKLNSIQNFENEIPKIQFSKEDIEQVMKKLGLDDKYTRRLYQQDRGRYAKEFYFTIPNYSDGDFCKTYIHNLKTLKGNEISCDEKMYIFSIKEGEIIENQVIYSYKSGGKRFWNTRVEYYYIKNIIQNEKVELIRIPNQPKYRKLFGLEFLVAMDEYYKTNKIRWDLYEEDEKALIEYLKENVEFNPDDYEDEEEMDEAIYQHINIISEDIRSLIYPLADLLVDADIDLVFLNEIPNKNIEIISKNEYKITFKVRVYNYAFEITIYNPDGIEEIAKILEQYQETDLKYDTFVDKIYEAIDDIKTQKVYDILNDFEIRETKYPQTKINVIYYFYKNQTKIEIYKLDVVYTKYIKGLSKLILERASLSDEAIYYSKEYQYIDELNEILEKAFEITNEEEVFDVIKIVREIYSYCKTPFFDFEIKDYSHTKITITFDINENEFLGDDIVITIKTQNYTTKVEFEKSSLKPKLLGLADEYNNLNEVFERLNQIKNNEKLQYNLKYISKKFYV